MKNEQEDLARKIGPLKQRVVQKFYKFELHYLKEYFNQFFHNMLK